MKSKIDNNLRNAKNIGATIEKYLNEIGIFTLADLAETTSVKAFIKIREQHPEKTIPVCYYLYSLEGALLNLHWNDIPSELKKELKDRVLTFKVKTGKQDQVFGTISTKQISSELEKIGYKIHEAQIEKVPYMLVIGEKEIEKGVKRKKK